MAGTRRLKNTRLHALEKQPSLDRSLAVQKPYLRLALAVITRALRDVTRPSKIAQEPGACAFGVSFDALVWLLEIGPAWATEAGVELDKENIFEWLASGAEVGK